LRPARAPRGRIKLCGVRTVEDALACASAGADELGIVFARGSKRCVSPAEAARIRGALPPGFPLIGVFLEVPASEALDVLRAVRLDGLQLHGARDPALVGSCRALSGVNLRLIAGLQIQGPESLAALTALAPFDRVLLDGPKGGGSGSAFDWTLARGARERCSQEIFVAGGLTPDNVSAAIDAGRPDGVDVASGIEGPDGFKDEALARLFVTRARAAFARL
jgi:phosphoribosylanthranilate isomerase